MKRHKYQLLRYYKISSYTELQHIALNYIKKNKFTPLPLKYSIIFYLNDNYLPKSKQKTCCLLTGRIRSTITLTHLSRHCFLASYNKGHISGFTFIN